MQFLMTLCNIHKHSTWYKLMSARQCVLMQCTNMHKVTINWHTVEALMDLSRRSLSLSQESLTLVWTNIVAWFCHELSSPRPAALTVHATSGKIACYKQSYSCTCRNSVFFSEWVAVLISIKMSFTSPSSQKSLIFILYIFILFYKTT